MRVASGLYLIPAELLCDEQGQSPWIEEYTGAIQVFLVLVLLQPQLCVCSTVLTLCHASTLPCSHKAAALALGTVVQINTVYSFSRKNYLYVVSLMLVSEG